MEKHISLLGRVYYMTAEHLDCAQFQVNDVRQ